MPAGYYPGSTPAAPSQLRCSLHATIKAIRYPYSGSAPIPWTILEIADEDPNNPNRILDAYRNRSAGIRSVIVRALAAPDLQPRAHLAELLGFASTTGDKGLPLRAVHRYHMLYLTDAQWNADRGNKPFGKCDASCGERATEANNAGRRQRVATRAIQLVRTPDGNTGTFEVGKRKGDMARAVMYMAIRYEAAGCGHRPVRTGSELTDDRSKIVKTSSSPAYMGLLSALIDWHPSDPPDDAERARNDVV